MDGLGNVFQNYLGNYYLEYIVFLNFQQYMIHLFMVEARMEYRFAPKKFSVHAG